MPISRRTCAGVILLGTLLLSDDSTLGAQQYSVTLSATAAFELAGTGPDGADVFGRIAAAVFDLSDRIIVADAGLNRISRFDVDGAWMLSTGRSGEGPGEYSLIEWIGLCGKESIVVFDLATRKFTVLDERLSYKHAFRQEGMPTMLACSTDGHLAYLNLSVDSQPSTATTWRGVAQLRVSTNLRDPSRVVGSFPLGDLVRVGGAWMAYPGGRRTSLAIFGHDVAMATGGKEPVQILDSLGRVRREIRLKPNAISFSDGILSSAADDFLGRVPDRAIRDAMARRLLGAQHAEVEVHYRRVMYDSNGLLWVQRSLRGDSAILLEIVDSKGGVVGGAEIQGSGDLIAVGRNRVALLVTKPDESQSVRVFEVVRERAK